MKAQCFGMGRRIGLGLVIAGLSLSAGTGLANSYHVQAPPSAGSILLGSQMPVASSQPPVSYVGPLYSYGGSSSMNSQILVESLPPAVSGNSGSGDTFSTLYNQGSANFNQPTRNVAVPDTGSTLGLLAVSMAVILALGACWRIRLEPRLQAVFCGNRRTVEL